MQISRVNSYSQNNYNNSQSKGQNLAFTAYPSKKFQGILMKSIYEDFRFDMYYEKEVSTITKKIKRFLNLLNDSGDYFTKLDIIEGNPANQGLVKLVISNNNLSEFVTAPALNKQLHKKSFYKEIVDNTYEIINKFDKSEDILIKENMSNLLEKAPSRDAFENFGKKCDGPMARKCSIEADLAKKMLSGIMDF